MSDIDPYYRAYAKDLTNFLFNKGFLHDHLSREAIDMLEDYLAFVFQSNSEMVVKGAALTKKCRDLMARHKPLKREESTDLKES